MGGTYSNIPHRSDSTSFCVTFRTPDKIKVIDAGPIPLEVIRQTIKLNYLQGLDKESIDYGAQVFKMKGWPYDPCSSQEDAFGGKVLACMLLQNLLAAGYVSYVSSDLSRNEQLSSWFFEQSNKPPDYDTRVCGIALSSDDSLHFINFPREILPEIKSDVQRTWSRGIQSDFEELSTGFVIKLKGYAWECDQKDAVEARMMLLSFVRTMARFKWVLYLSTSVKCTTDTMFFRYNPNFEFSPDQIQNSFILSLNKTDRLRLIEAPQSVHSLVKDCVVKNWSPGLKHAENYHGSFDLCLKDSPWDASGETAVYSRLFVTVLLQRLRAEGWYVLETISMSRKPSAKSVLVMVKGAPCDVPHFCLSFNKTDVLRFINTPKDVLDMLRKVVHDKYSVGVKNEKIYAGFHEMTLRGDPWFLVLNGNESILGLHVVREMLDVLSAAGWRIVCSADVSAKYHSDREHHKYPTDVHSMWFCQHRVPETAGAVGFSDPPPLYPNLEAYGVN